MTLGGNSPRAQLAPVKRTHSAALLRGFSVSTRRNPTGWEKQPRHARYAAGTSHPHEVTSAGGGRMSHPPPPAKFQVFEIGIETRHAFMRKHLQ